MPGVGRNDPETSNSNARLVLLPGLGVDARFFAPLCKAFPNIIVPDWIDPLRGESLADYAKRMAATIAVEEPFYLGGASFGGMVALEMARTLRPEAVFLIGSCRSNRSIPFVLKSAERLSRALPSGFVRFVLKRPRLALRQFGPMNEFHRHGLLSILDQTNVGFLRWGAQAIVEWPGCEGISVPVHHIHGDHDRLIPPRLVEPDAWVDGAGHVLSWTHSDEVGGFIAERIE